MLPYREIDQSGVLFTALAFGKPLLLSDVGGFPEIAATGAARLVPRRATRGALHGALRRAARRTAASLSAHVASAARAAASGEYSWASIAERTLALYRSLLLGPQSFQKSCSSSPSLSWRAPNTSTVSPSGPGLERARDLRRDADRVERRDLDDLVVEAHAPVAGDHDVDLLGLLVAVAERAALAGLSTW